MARAITRAAASGDTETTLRAGQVAAWAVGLAQFRESALASAESLPDDALAAAIGAPEPLEAAATVAQLRADRWWRPDREPPEAGSVVHRVGGFRGFGGPFLAPPEVVTTDGHVEVRSGDDVWALHADAWGATLTRQGDGGGADVTAVTIPTSYRRPRPGARVMTLAEDWRATWPGAVSVWSRFTRLRDPLLCETTAAAREAGLRTASP